MMNHTTEESKAMQAKAIVAGDRGRKQIGKAMGPTALRFRQLQDYVGLEQF